MINFHGLIISSSQLGCMCCVLTTEHYTCGLLPSIFMKIDDIIKQSSGSISFNDVPSQYAHFLLLPLPPTV
jgi:hypothetical protein